MPISTNYPNFTPSIEQVNLVDIPNLKEHWKTLEGTLVIDTATRYLLISVVVNGFLYRIFENLGFSHGEQLAPNLERLQKECDFSWTKVQRILVAAGPGSFTGLRIGVSTAKGIASVYSIPVYAGSSLDAQAFFFSGTNLSLMFGRKQRYYWRVYKDSLPLDKIHDSSIDDIHPQIIKQLQVLSEQPRDRKSITILGIDSNDFIKDYTQMVKKLDGEDILQSLHLAPENSINDPSQIEPWDIGMLGLFSNNRLEILKEYHGPVYYRGTEAVLPQGKEISKQESAGILPPEL
jgi:tRNA threonylcarbamoyl adenosine modification protein YeaZ